MRRYRLDLIDETVIGIDACCYKIIKGFIQFVGDDNKVFLIYNVDRVQSISIKDK